MTTKNYVDNDDKKLEEAGVESINEEPMEPDNFLAHSSVWNYICPKQWCWGGSTKQSGVQASIQDSLYLLQQRRDRFQHTCWKGDYRFFGNWNWCWCLFWMRIPRIDQDSE